jgi:hypothetical protein
MKGTIALLRAATLSLAMAAHAAPTPAPTNLDSGEQEVLAAFLSPSSGFQTGTTNFVVMETTSSDRVRQAASRLREEVIPPRFDAPLREAVEDLVRKAKADVRVRVPTNQTAHVTIISQAELFHKFPGAKGSTRISRIGIDSKQTVAIVDVTESGNGGGTRFYVLRRQDKVWRTTGESVLGFENRYE